MRRVKEQSGMSLVEATIILLVLMLLTGVLAPSIFDYVWDGRVVKVKEDCEAIGVSIARFVRDNGPCFKFNGRDACTVENKVDVLYSNGLWPVYSGAVDAFGYNWNSGKLGFGDHLENHLVTNFPNYPTVGDLGNFLWTYPSFRLGWRGAYLSPPIGPDPWGNKYLVNSRYMTPEGTEGNPPGHDEDVICVSAGPDGEIQTRFNGTSTWGTKPTAPSNDDFVFVIQGSSR